MTPETMLERTGLQSSLGMGEGFWGKSRYRGPGTGNNQTAFDAAIMQSTLTPLRCHAMPGSGEPLADQTEGVLGLQLFKEVQG